MQEIHRRYVHEEKPAKISSKKKIFYFLFSFFPKISSISERRAMALNVSAK